MFFTFSERAVSEMSSESNKRYLNRSIVSKYEHYVFTYGTLCQNTSTTCLHMRTRTSTMLYYSLCWAITEKKKSLDETAPRFKMRYPGPARVSTLDWQH